MSLFLLYWLLPAPCHPEEQRDEGSRILWHRTPKHGILLRYAPQNDSRIASPERGGACGAGRGVYRQFDKLTDPSVTLRVPTTGVSSPFRRATGCRGRRPLQDLVSS